MQNGRSGKGFHEGPQKGETARSPTTIPQILNESTPQEDELRMSGDPRYAHLLEDLHVEISTFAAPAEAHARIAYALAEVRRFLVPVSEEQRLPI